ncbi:hypothetical protein FB451DRAFT_76175 [Mycena latifolia]|nr:hypothetical protein FB451DRAFT_76175 [Mycena latifolia]
MPREPTITDIQLSSITACLTPVLPLLNELHDGCGTPFLQAISNTTLALISAMQNVKRNKEECIQLMENIHHILYSIVKLHMQSEPAGTLPPSTLDHIGHFTNTLHKIHTFLQIQQDGNIIKHFFRQNELRVMFNECRAELGQASAVFTIGAGATALIDAFKMQEQAQKMHSELLAMIMNLTDGQSSERSSSIYQMNTDSENSSNSFAMLPAQPKIFHGRDSELQEILKIMNGQSPRIAILGAGGMGKTSLAKAALHHPNIRAKYPDRFFVPCESAATSVELADILGLSLGLRPGKGLTQSVVQYFATAPPCLLVLDNLETSWERVGSRSSVEELLSLLTDVGHLALIITMRGAERPAKVRWTRPLLPPLAPLSDAAARQTFLDITDGFHDSQEVIQLLQLTDNMPLAVNLLAHLVDYEGCSSVLSRWRTEKTSLLSEGHNKMTNLDASISVSLSSARMTSGAKELLTLLSIFPDGLSDAELLQSNLSIHNILTCKAVLLQTSLALSDNMRLKVLVPVREHMQRLHPPSLSLVRPLQKYFHALLDLFRTHVGVQVNGVINQINSNLGNLNDMLLFTLRPDNPDIKETIYCTLWLNAFRRHSGHGHVQFIDQIPAVFPQPCDHSLETNFIIELFLTAIRCPIADPESLVKAGLNHLANFNDNLVAARFHLAVGSYYHTQHNDPTLSMGFFDKALIFAKSSGDSSQQARVLLTIASLHWHSGNYHAAQIRLHEAQDISRLAGNLFLESIAMGTEATCSRELGNNKASIALCQKARQLLTLCGMTGGSNDNDHLYSPLNTSS